jgi:BirA family biotin operon repressor/biotin-[acetyl-CoA-carboxylase] ligase
MRDAAPELRKVARKLRATPTDAEYARWQALRQWRPRFTRQYPIGRAIPDFVCRKARLVIEVDGGQHNDSKRDPARTAALKERGWRVIRFWNHDVLGNTDGVVLMILEAVRSRVPPTVEVFALPEVREPRARKPRSRKAKS